MQDLINIIKSLPNWAQLFAFPIVLAGAWIARNILSKAEVQNGIALSIRKKLRVIDSNELLKHSLFANVEFYKRKISGLQFKNDEHKTRLFKTLLYIKLDTSVEIIRQLITGDELKKESVNLKELLYRSINQIIGAYEKRIKQEFINQYGKTTGAKLYAYIMDSENGFNAYHSRNILHIFDLIDVICKTGIFDNKYEKLFLYMHEINNALRYAVFDAETVFYSFNGHIKYLIEND